MKNPLLPSYYNSFFWAIISPNVKTLWVANGDKLITPKVGHISVCVCGCGGGGLGGGVASIHHWVSSYCGFLHLEHKGRCRLTMSLKDVLRSSYLFGYGSSSFSSFSMLSDMARFCSSLSGDSLLVGSGKQMFKVDNLRTGISSIDISYTCSMCEREVVNRSFIPWWKTGTFFGIVSLKVKSVVHLGASHVH